MRITDARTGEHTGIRPRRAGLLRVTVAVGARDHRLGFGDLRALLAGDVLARTCEALGVQVFVGLAVPEGSDEQVRTLLEAAGQLDIHPPARLSAYGEAADLVITSRPWNGPGPRPPAVLAVGPVTAELPQDGQEPAPDLSGVLPVSGHDPFVLRLVLLEHAVAEPVRLTAAALAESAARLSRWRSLVADLACEPSGPVDAGLVQAGFDGLDEDLDARTALRALRQVLEEPAGLSAGTRFETCVRLDQVLALELARDIGRGPR